MFIPGVTKTVTRVGRNAVFGMKGHAVKGIRAASTQVYHEGLHKTEFTNTLNISKDSPTIPIYRILNADGTLAPNCENPFDKTQTIDLYKFMLRLNIWDAMMYNVQRQGRFSFYIQNQGEEAVHAGIGKALQPQDNLFCQYRELGVLLSKGFTIKDALCQLYSNGEDPGKGRQMPISYTKKEIGLHTICTPLTTQLPHAAGAGYAFRLSKEDKIAVAFFGEGAASEGDFHAGVNFAATLKGNTLFICKNNGYAISTPVKDQYAGDGIAIRGIAYGMPTVRVDGNDVFAVYLATKKAREIVVENRAPAMMELMTYRVGHHSTSDDSSQYRPSGEIEAWQSAGALPLARFKHYLTNNGWWTEAEEEELRKDARASMLEEMKQVEKIKRFPIISGIFDDVYSHPVPHIEDQRKELQQHMATFGDKYNTSRYAPS